MVRLTFNSIQYVFSRWYFYFIATLKIRFLSLKSLTVIVTALILSACQPISLSRPVTDGPLTMSDAMTESATPTIKLISGTTTVHTLTPTPTQLSRTVPDDTILYLHANASSKQPPQILIEGEDLYLIDVFSDFSKKE